LFFSFEKRKGERYFEGKEERRMSLKEQLDLLWELQKIDLELKEIKASQEDFPREIQRLDEKQKVEREKVQKEKERIDSLEKERRRKESQLGMEQERVKKTEGKMLEVKTNKEYQALLTEIENLKGTNNREEEEILQLLEEIDDLKNSLLKREKEIHASLAKIEGEKKVLQERIVQDQVVLKRQIDRRQVVTQHLESNLYRLYNTIQEKRMGRGVVSVKQETCQGCFVHVPPQLFIEVQKNTSLIRCPNCNRILYWEAAGDPK
jgi:predicted  nucleic acid-binding Zn-ribbon protein